MLGVLLRSQQDINTKALVKSININLCTEVKASKLGTESQYMGSACP